MTLEAIVDAKTCFSVENKKRKPSGIVEIRWRPNPERACRDECDDAYICRVWAELL